MALSQTSMLPRHGTQLVSWLGPPESFHEEDCGIGLRNPPGPGGQEPEAVPPSLEGSEEVVVGPDLAEL